MPGRLRRLARGLVHAGPVSVAELLAALAVLGVLAAVAFGRQVADGGFYSDDWANVAAYRYADSPRYLTSVGTYQELLGSRPLLAVLLPVPYAVLGLDPAPHLLMALVLGVLTCLCLYRFLRAIPLAPVHSGAIAALALVFPWADSIRLWPTASVNTVALMSAFLGGFLALRGIDGTGWRARLALAGSAVLYACSVLTYEVAGIGLLLVGALYLRHAPRGRALRWWALHAAVVIAALAYTALTTEKAVGTAEDRIRDTPSYARQAVTILSYSFLPPDTTGAGARVAVLLVAGAIVAAGIWRYRTSRDRSLGQWLVLSAASAVVIVSAYLVTLGAFLEPLRPGVYNRGNLFAAFGFAGLVYGLVMIAAGIFRDHRAARVVAGVVVVLTMSGYVVRARDDTSDWIRAWRLQQPVVAAAVEASRGLPDGATLFTFGYPSQLSPGIPIFYVGWDLDGALRLRAKNDSLHAYPVYESGSLLCGARGISIRYRHSGSSGQADYSNAYFLDVPSGALRRVESVSSCTRALRRFRPGREYWSPESSAAHRSPTV